MKQILLLFFIATFYWANAQVIVTDPVFPIADKAVTLTFNAAGTGLEGYTGDVYAHTGVTIEGQGQWKNVIGSWGVNTSQPKLTRTATDMYEMVITPSINDFYSVTSGDKVTEICLVFRSSDGGSQTDDLFVDVYEETLNVTLINPEKDFLVEPNTNIAIEVAATKATNLKLYVDDILINETTNESITTSITSETSGKHWIKAEATDGTNTVFDSIYYYVKQAVNVAELSTGVKKGINYINDTTVTLVLYAPEKEYVYLIGDFNDWDVSNTLETTYSNPTALQVTATTWLMNRTADSKYYWFTINNVKKNAEYAFQYWIDGDIVVADPYTEKILDPWNDKYISSATYPNLKAYPDGKTSEAVSVFQTAQDAYQWEVNDFTPPAVTDMVVYEMLVRDFVAAHDYKTIIDTLDYIDRLGINVLELMPINEFEGNSSWGYNPSFYFAPDKYYGPKEDLKKLVDACHKRGIAVVIDMVLNHSYGQSPFVRMYFDNGAPAANNPWYNVSSPNTTYSWGYDFNHESDDTKALVDSINSFWMTQYKVDGFRFDFTKGFTNTTGDGWAYDASRIAILERMYNHIKSVNQNAYVILEHLTDNSEEKVLANYGLLLWGNLNGAYNEATMGWNESGKSDFSWISYQKRGWNSPNALGYMESHDEERLMYKNMKWGNSNGDYDITNLYTSLNRIELAANFFFTIPGPKMIWQFGELGYDISIDEGGRVSEKPILWEYQQSNSRERVYDVFSNLAKLKTQEPAFETTDYSLSVYSALKTIHLNSDDMDVVVLGNFDVVSGEVNPEFQQAGTWYEFYTGAELDVTDTQATITLNPGEYRLYTTKKFDVPDINPWIGESQVIEKDQLQVYPNPVDDKLYIGINANYQTIQIFNIMGQQMVQQNNFSSTNAINVHDLIPGVYVVAATDAKGNVTTSRFIKN